MSGEKYKKLKKEIKQKIKKIKDYEISDNKLAALVFIITAVLGLRAGNYFRLFVFEHETKKRKKEKEEKYSNIYGEPELEELDLQKMPSDNESKWDGDDSSGAGALPTVSLFGKNKNRKFKKVALATLLGGGLGIGTGIYLRDNKIKKERKIEEKKRKEIEERMKEDDEDFERLQKKLRESDAPESRIEEPRKKIEFEKFDQKNFNKLNTPFKDDITSEINSGDTRLQEQGDYDRAMGELEKSKKKLKEDKKKTKKKKKWFSRNKDIKKKIGIIKEQIKENEKQSEEFQEIYEDYLDNKEKRLSKRQLSKLLLKGKDKENLIKLMSEEAGEDPNNLKYFTLRELKQRLEKYPFWKLQTIYEADMGKQEEISSVLDYYDAPVQEVMLFGKKKRKRRKKKRK